MIGRGGTIPPFLSLRTARKRPGAPKNRRKHQGPPLRTNHGSLRLPGSLPGGAPVRGAPAGIAPRPAEIRGLVPRHRDVGPGPREVRRVALHLRNPGLLLSRRPHRRTVERRGRDLHQRVRPPLDEDTRVVPRRAPRGDPQRDLRPLGDLRPRAGPAGRVHETRDEVPGLDSFLQGTGVRPEHAGGGGSPFDHDRPVHPVGQQGGARHGPAAAEGGGPRRWEGPVGR